MATQKPGIDVRKWKLGDTLVEDDGKVIDGGVILNSGYADGYYSGGVTIEKVCPITGNHSTMHLSREEAAAIAKAFPAGK